MIEKGCYKEMTNEDYHSIKSHFSRSALMDFSKSPFTYWSKHINPDRPKKDASRSMIIGSAFHTLILEPHLFNDQYAIRPPKVLLKDVGREQYEIYKSICEGLEKDGKTVLEENEFSILSPMQRAFNANKNAVELTHNARIENSFFWKDEETGMLLKARPDILHENMIVDLKTCSDASPRAYQSEMVKYGYHVQGAMIRDAVEAIEGRRINNVINICVETKYPYSMGIYLLDEAAIDAGQAKYKQLLIDIKSAIEDNNYPDYGVQTIGLPSWAN